MGSWLRNREPISEPKELAAEEPAVYAELAKLYRLNPMEW